MKHASFLFSSLYGILSNFVSISDSFPGQTDETNQRRATERKTPRDGEQERDSEDKETVETVREPGQDPGGGGQAEGDCTQEKT